jgi:predicted alpha/beta hydrolase family esterase
MNRQILFVQGGGEGAHDAWDNRLVDSLGRLLGTRYEIRYPLMPSEADPSYASWKTALMEEIAALDDGAILIGHSIGGAILINVLAEQESRCKPAAVFLIAAPYIGQGGWPLDDMTPMSNLGSRLPNDLPIYLYHGDADEIAPFAHLALYARAIPHAAACPLKGRDHQLNSDMTEVARDIERLGQNKLSHGRRRRR